MRQENYNTDESSNKDKGEDIMENDRDMVVASSAMQINETAMTIVEMKNQVNLIQHAMKEVMQDGIHYGKIPGCGDKPTLLKPGAEKICMLFRLAPEYEELPGSGESDDYVGYKIKCTLVHILSGTIVANGLGACNSKEKKYLYRSVYLNKATKEEQAIGRIEKRPAKNGGSFDVLIVPQSPWDNQNTIYKMACKRALVAACLNATAASDIFTQDIEDMTHIHQKKEASMPKRKEEKKEEIDYSVCQFGKNKDSKWVDMTMGQLEAYSTLFDEGIADPAKAQYKANNEMALKEVLKAMEVVGDKEASKDDVPSFK